MGTATHRVTTTNRYAFSVPTPAALAEVNKAMHWASQTFKKVHDREVNYDDDLMVTVGDDEVIIYFDVVEKP